MRFTGVLLAAGFGRRFGADKRTLGLPDGSSLLTHGARSMRLVLDDVVVVLRAGETPLAQALSSLGCRFAFNPRPLEGLGSSIRCGVATSANSDGWLILPADLPLVRPTSLRRVVARLATASAVVPLCHGRRGHPVGFSRRFRGELLALTGDRAGREVLKRAPKEVVWLNLHDPGIYRDVDQASDFDSIRRDFAPWQPHERPP